MIRTLYAAILAAILLFPSLAAAQNVNLNMVAVGVNRYRQPGMDLRFSAPDAQDVANAMNANRLFARKDVNLLLNEQATAQNIMNAVALLERRATANTYSVLYLSGHGSRSAAGHFLYCPHDYDGRRAEATSVAGEALYARLKRMPGRVILILDACHSGATGWTKTHFVNPAPTNQTIVISSSLAREYSLELPEFRNGAFTQAFLEALSGRADANKNGTISLQEMHNYVYTRVSQITGGKQHMITFVPSVALGNITLASAPRPAAAASNVWQGRESLQGFGSLRFNFENNGRVTMVDAKGTSAGSWSKQGNTVTLRFASGRVVYTGQISGNNLSGTAVNGKTRWSFSVARQ